MSAVPGVNQAASMLDQIGLVPPLIDPLTGYPYPADELPCAGAEHIGVGVPSWWDEDAEMALRQTAAEICRELCPALKECAARRMQLGSLARGVWAAEIVVNSAADKRAVYDASVAAWIRESGTPVGTRTRRPANGAKAS